MSIMYHTAKLCEIAELNPRLDESLESNAPVSFLPMSAVTAETASTTVGEERQYGAVSKGYTPFHNGDVLVAKITPCFENGKIAQATISHRIGFGSTEFHVVRPINGKSDARYLLHFLRQERIRRDGERKMTGSAGQRRVPEHFLAGIEIHLPPLDKQRRIAKILDRAEALRAKRRTTIAQLDILTQAIFLDLFGDVDANNWPEPEIASLVVNKPNAIRTGPFGSQLIHSEFVDSGIAVLGIDNAVQNKFVWARPRFITEKKYQQLQRYKVFSGDVLITIMGTCSRCAVVPDKIPTAINTKHLSCISLDQSRCLPIYLHACFLLHPKVQHRLGVKEHGAVMPGLNMQVIKELRVPLPPLDLQREFARRVAAVDKLKAAHRTSLAEMDALFTSLQHRAFQGEL